MTDLKPYDYQISVAKRLLAGDSVVLQAPTGAGKTAAALLPYIHARRTDTRNNFPTKCVYVVPMRVLANQFVAEFQKYAEPYSRVFRREIRATIQTGERPEDRRFDRGDVVFCTVDQFLSSFLLMPYGLSNRLANLNAGAMVGTYLVFDEFHLLDPQSTLPTVLYAIKQLHTLAPVLLMTATFSREMLDALGAELSAQAIAVPPSETAAIETGGGQTPPRQRTWYASDAELTAEGVLATHRTRSLAICNTVKRAQALYRDLRSLCSKRSPNVEILLLHSRFLKEDRQQNEQRLRTLFGKNHDRTTSAILVGTQTIEVGVDITSDILHTELAPASALIQRAGRCARFPGEQGSVVVHPVPDYAPYGKGKEDPGDESPWIWEMRAVLEWLKARSGTVLDFSKEQEMINAVSTPRDRQILEDLSAGRVTHAETVHRVLINDRQGNESRVLVRDVDSRLLLIHPSPHDLTTNPFAATGFAIPTKTLYGMLKDWLNRPGDLEWRVMRLIQDSSSDDSRARYDWEPLTVPSLLWATRVLVVNPVLAGYWPDEGLVPERGDSGFESSSSEDASKQTWDGALYRLESYEDHVRRVAEAFATLALPDLEYPAWSLERRAGWERGSIVRAAWLSCLFHDVGKLGRLWQRWAREYQSEIGAPVGSRLAVAHTDWDERNPVHVTADKRVRAKFARPPHAAQSAFAVGPVLVQAFGRELEPLVVATLSAIARHHAPFAHECDLFELEPASSDYVDATLPFLPGRVREGVDLHGLKSLCRTRQRCLLARPDQESEWLAYLLLARALRRADQRGTEVGCSV